MVCASRSLGQQFDHFVRLGSTINIVAKHDLNCMGNGVSFPVSTDVGNGAFQQIGAAVYIANRVDSRTGGCFGLDCNVSRERPPHVSTVGLRSDIGGVQPAELGPSIANK